MLLAPIKEKKVAHQTWIKEFAARDYPNIFPQLCIILAFRSSTIKSAIVYALVSYTIHAFTIV